MRTNKACPLYTGSMGGGNSSPVETDPEPPQTDPDEDDLGYVDGVKLMLNTTKIKVRILLSNGPETPLFLAVDVVKPDLRVWAAASTRIQEYCYHQFKSMRDDFGKCPIVLYREVSPAWLIMNTELASQ